MIRKAICFGVTGVIFTYFIFSCISHRTLSEKLLRSEFIYSDTPTNYSERLTDPAYNN